MVKRRGNLSDCCMKEIHLLESLAIKDPSRFEYGGPKIQDVRPPNGGV